MKQKPKNSAKKPSLCVIADSFRRLMMELLDLKPLWRCRECGQSVHAELVGKGDNCYFRCPECRMPILRPNCFQLRLIQNAIRAEKRRQYEASLGNSH